MPIEYIEIKDQFIHGTNKQSANLILKQGFNVVSGGNQRFTEGVYFTKKLSSYGDTFLNCLIKGNFINFSDDVLGDDWIELKSSYSWNNYKELTDLIKEDHPTADGILFHGILVVWYPNKCIKNIELLNINERNKKLNNLLKKFK